MFSSSTKGILMTSSNAQWVKQALIELFVKRDLSAIDRYWAAPYLQHNPSLPDGVELLRDIVAGLQPDFSYEPGMVVAQGDMLMVHGRYSGWRPKPVVAVDIFLVKDGRMVEHWDVLQEEVPSYITKSQRPMFGLPQWTQESTK
jgi:predicted SnoaL-like aldol condensation-catalyzing enzyme